MGTRLKVKWCVCLLGEACRIKDTTFKLRHRSSFFFFKDMMYYAFSCCCLEQHLFLNLLFNVFIFPPVRLPSLPMVALPLTTSSIPSYVSRDKKKIPVEYFERCTCTYFSNRDAQPVTGNSENSTRYKKVTCCNGSYSFMRSKCVPSSLFLVH